MLASGNNIYIYLSQLMLIFPSFAYLEKCQSKQMAGYIGIVRITSCNVACQEHKKIKWNGECFLFDVFIGAGWKLNLWHLRWQIPSEMWCCSAIVNCAFRWVDRKNILNMDGARDANSNGNFCQDLVNWHWVIASIHWNRPNITKMDLPDEGEMSYSKSPIQMNVSRRRHSDG